MYYLKICTSSAYFKILHLELVYYYQSTCYIFLEGNIRYTGIVEIGSYIMFTTKNDTLLKAILSKLNSFHVQISAYNHSIVRNIKNVP